MTRLALLVGINSYPFAELSSGIKDAVDVRNALVQHGVFAAEETLLLTDGPDAQGPATREEILKRLKGLHDGEPCERFLFYFSGHGLSIRSGRGAGGLNAVLLCQGVQSVPDDGDKMISLDELTERFHLRGPDEQFWIIDACRNIPEEQEPPIVPEIAWGKRNSIAQRKRGVLYAVAPLARASAAVDGNGRFTSQLLEGLAGRGRAAVWDEPTEEWVVTIGSLCDYARARLDSGSQDQWELARLPRVELVSEPPPLPIRVLPESERPQERQVTLHVEPPEAMPAVAAMVRRRSRVHGQWPPHGRSIRLEPDVYTFSAELVETTDWRSLSPGHDHIDTREVDQIRVRVEKGTPKPGTTRAILRDVEAAKPGVPAAPQVQVSRKRIGDRDASSQLMVSASVEGITVILQALSSANTTRRVSANQWTRIDPGLWRIEISLGSELVSRLEEEIGPGEHVEVALQRRAPRSAFETRAPTRMRAEDSEIGLPPGLVTRAALPLQAYAVFAPPGSVRPSLLLPGFQPIQTSPREAYLSVALTLAGKWSADDLITLLDSASVHVSEPGPRSLLTRRWTSPDLALFCTELPQSIDPLARLSDHFGGNVVHVIIPRWGELRFAIPVLPARVACAGIAIRPDGSYEFALASLPIAQSAGRLLARDATDTSRAVAIAANLLGQRFDLTEVTRALREAAEGKWLDPLLGALAWHGYKRIRSVTEIAGPSLATIARMLVDAFPGLIDGHVQLMQSAEPTNLGEPHPGTLLAYTTEPILADSIDELASLARSAGQRDHWALRQQALIDPNSVWNVVKSSDHIKRQGRKE